MFVLLTGKIENHIFYTWRYIISSKILIELSYKLVILIDFDPSYFPDDI